MRIIEPHHLRPPKKPRTSKRIAWRTMLILLAFIVLSTSLLGVWVYSLPLPKLSASAVTVTSKGTLVALPWPAANQSSIGTVSEGLLASTKYQKPVPIASIAKVITALAVLRAKPIGKTDQGPTLTLTDADVALYNQYVAINGSVVAVNNGEKITERQALEAILLPSSNNMSDSLAIWAFGSLKNYSVYANNMVRELGLKNTTITSASGFDQATVSTASDLVRLGIITMNNPVLAAIVGQKTAINPVAGRLSNVNILLGHSGIVGIKTGNTDEAGGCYLYASNYQLPNGQNVIIIGAILGATDLATALRGSLSLITASHSNFIIRKLASKGDKLGYYDLPWGGQAAAIATKDLVVWGWRGSNLSAQIYLNDIAVPKAVGSVVGKIQNGNQSVNLTLDAAINTPSKRWRLVERW